MSDLSEQAEPTDGQNDPPAEVEALRVRIETLETELERWRAREALAGNLLRSAATRAATIREEARHEAEVMLRKAAAHSHRSQAAAQRERSTVERELVRLRRIAAGTRESLSALLAATLVRVSPENDGETETLTEVLGERVDYEVSSRQVSDATQPGNADERVSEARRGGTRLGSEEGADDDTAPDGEARPVEPSPA